MHLDSTFCINSTISRVFCLEGDALPPYAYCGTILASSSKSSVRCRRETAWTLEPPQSMPIQTASLQMSGLLGFAVMPAA
jgi:hypothetical protein